MLFDITHALAWLNLRLNGVMGTGYSYFIVIANERPICALIARVSCYINGHYATIFRHPLNDRSVVAQAIGT